MSDAMRKLNGKLPDWMQVIKTDKIEPIVPLSTIDDIAEIIRMARYEGQIDRQTATWNAVTAWAAKELLEVFSQMETAEGSYAVELRARSKTLRDMLAMCNKSKEDVKFVETPQYIP